MLEICNPKIASKKCRFIFKCSKRFTQCFIQREGPALQDIDFPLPEFAVLALETTDLSFRKIFSLSRKKNPR
jgi:hypothetical protein